MISFDKFFFDKLWNDNNFANSNLKNDEYIKGRIKKVWHDHLNSENIKLLRIDDWAYDNKSVTIDVGYTNLTTNTNSSIQVNIDLVSKLVVPYSVNF